MKKQLKRQLKRQRQSNESPRLNQETSPARFVTKEEDKRNPHRETLAAPLRVLFSLPWCCIIPGLLGLLGATGAGLALAPALRALTYPLFALTILSLGWGWYRELRFHHETKLAGRSRMLLMISTLLATFLWILRFTGWGLTGASP